MRKRQKPNDVILRPRKEEREKGNRTERSNKVFIFLTVAAVILYSLTQTPVPSSSHLPKTFL